MPDNMKYTGVYEPDSALLFAKRVVTNDLWDGFSWLVGKERVIL